MIRNNLPNSQLSTKTRHNTKYRHLCSPYTLAKIGKNVILSSITSPKRQVLLNNITFFLIFAVFGV